MDQFLGTEPVPFDLFGPAHVTAMAALAAAGWWLIRAGMASDARGRRRLRIAIIVAIVLLRLATHAWKVAIGLWEVEADLGLHLCSVMSWITVYGLWTRRPWALRLMYFFGVAGAVQAVVTPDVIYGLWHYTFFETMLSHGLLVMAGVWAVKVESYRPTARDPWLLLGLLNLYAVVMYPLNRLLGSNYLYVVDKPPTASILDYFPDWPWYLLLLQPVAVALFVALYLPFRNPAGARR